jgi:hypothetical protein
MGVKREAQSDQRGRRGAHSAPNAGHADSYPMGTFHGNWLAVNFDILHWARNTHPYAPIATLANNPSTTPLVRRPPLAIIRWLNT